MTGNDVMRLAGNLLFAGFGVMVLSYIITVLVHATIKRRFRRLGLSRADAAHLFEMRGMLRWRSRHPVLSIATNRWYRVKNGDIANHIHVPTETKEAFELRMETFRERFGELWLPMSVSVAHDVQTAFFAGAEVEAADRHLDLLDEAMPHVQDVRDFAHLVLAIGTESACSAVKLQLPMDYVSALYPPAPTYAAPLSKERFLRESYEPTTVFDFQEA